jgi:hypothetical protein
LIEQRRLTIPFIRELLATRGPPPNEREHGPSSTAAASRTAAARAAPAGGDHFDAHRSAVNDEHDGEPGGALPVRGEQAGQRGDAARWRRPP